MRKIEGWQMKVFIWIGLPLIAVIGLAFGSVDVLPSWKAKNGDGVVGTFTAQREDCGRRTCSFYGDWVSADGTSKRTDVILYDEPDSLSKGGTVEAIDSGARKGVFATAGGFTYLLVSGLTLAGVIAAIVWVVLVLRRLRKVMRKRIAGDASLQRS